eukprot:gene6070-biopygen5821
MNRVRASAGRRAAHGHVDGGQPCTRRCGQALRWARIVSRGAVTAVVRGLRGRSVQRTALWKTSAQGRGGGQGSPVENHVGAAWARIVAAVSHGQLYGRYLHLTSCATWTVGIWRRCFPQSTMHFYSQ